MDLSEILNRSWSFMTRLTRNIGNLIILFALNVIPIVNFTVIGYCAEITRLGESIDSPPKIGNYFRLFIQGLKIVIAALIYALIPIILLIILCPAAIHALLPVPHPIALISGVILLGVIPALIVAFIIFIIGAMGIIHMIKTGEFIKAFAFGEIIDRIKSIGLGMYLAWLIVMFGLSIIISSLSRVHWIVSSIIEVFYLVFLARSAHYIYGL